MHNHSHQYQLPYLILNIFAAQPDNKLLEEFLIIALHKANRIEEAKEIINKSE